MKKDQSICSHISSMLGAHECIQLVVYGIGSFEFDVKSQYQIAFALLLKEDNIFPISDIEIYDPSLPPADVKACFDLDLRVLLVNEQCQRSVDKPIIFFVPGLAFVGNLIESNFSPEQLNNIILISYGVKNIGDRISAELENWNNGFTSLKGSPELERERFIWASINYINEVIVMENFNAHFWGVSDMRFEFLDVAADVDMNSNLPSMCFCFRTSSIYTNLPHFFLFSLLLFDGGADFARPTLKEKFLLNFKLELEYNSFFAFEYAFLRLMGNILLLSSIHCLVLLHAESCTVIVSVFSAMCLIFVCAWKKECRVHFKTIKTIARMVNLKTGHMNSCTESQQCIGRLGLLLPKVGSSSISTALVVPKIVLLAWVVYFTMRMVCSPSLLVH